MDYRMLQVTTSVAMNIRSTNFDVLKMMNDDITYTYI